MRYKKFNVHSVYRRGDVEEHRNEMRQCAVKPEDVVYKFETGGPVSVTKNKPMCTEISKNLKEIRQIYVRGCQKQMEEGKTYIVVGEFGKGPNGEVYFYVDPCSFVREKGQLQYAAEVEPFVKEFLVSHLACDFDEAARVETVKSVLSEAGGNALALITNHVSALEFELKRFQDYVDSVESRYLRVLGLVVNIKPLQSLQAFKNQNGWFYTREGERAAKQASRYLNNLKGDDLYFLFNALCLSSLNTLSMRDGDVWPVHAIRKQRVTIMSDSAFMRAIIRQVLGKRNFLLNWAEAGEGMIPQILNRLARFQDKGKQLNLMMYESQLRPKPKDLTNRVDALMTSYAYKPITGERYIFFPSYVTKTYFFLAKVESMSSELINKGLMQYQNDANQRERILMQALKTWAEGIKITISSATQKSLKGIAAYPMIANLKFEPIALDRD